MTYGDPDVIKTRTDATPETFGLDDEEEPSEALDEFVEALQERASDEVERYCSRRFDLVEGTVDRLRGTGRAHLSTRNDPVQEIHRIEEGGRELDDDEYRIVPVDGNPDDNIGRIERLRGTRRGRWRPTEITIEYDWGYDDEDRPKMVDQVVENMVVSVLNEAEAERNASGVQSESMDGYSVTWNLADATERLTLTEAMQESLRPLRRRGVA